MKNKKHKFMCVASLALAASLSFSTMTAFADWKQEGNTWKYQNSDGKYATSTWQWINGKSYCFDSNGNMYANTTTPDGYTVNADGAWTVNGVVQIKNETSKKAYSDNDQYPLAHLKDWFVLNSRGKLVSKWSNEYMYEYHPELNGKWNDKYNYNGYGDYIKSKAAENHDISIADKGTIIGEPFYAVARLAGVAMPGYEAAENSAETLAIEKELRDFLNSFDWKNASDYEKAVHVARRVNRAEYDNTTSSCHLAYGCLVDGKASCDGFASAANLLAWCIDLPSTIVASLAANHAYVVYCINGVWVSHEATSHDESFHIADPQNDIYMIGSSKKYGTFADYCDRTGYTVPSNDVILSKLAGHARVIDNLGRITVDFN